MLCSTDKGYGNDYMNVANGAKSVIEEVLPSKFVSVQAVLAKLPAVFINDGAGMPSK